MTGETGSMRDWLSDGARQARVVGHRGAMAYRPENTMASFAHAVELGADWVECDVHLSMDGQLIVVHDETLDRTTDGTGFVKDHTLDQIKRLDAGSWFHRAYAGERVPTLPELLAWAAARRVPVDIEIKNAPVYYEGIERAVVQALDEAGMSDQAIVISFDHAAVKRVHDLDDRVATGVLYAGRPIDAIALARQAGADALLPHWAYVTRDDVATAHRARVAVAPWATSDPEILRRLIRAGVDAIGTNHPDVMRRVLDEMGNSVQET